MKLVEMKCKNCGAVLQAKLGTTDIHCDHCKANYKLDDEVKRVKYVDMENAGYEYEKGRLRARIEHEKALAVEQDKQIDMLLKKYGIGNDMLTPEEEAELAAIQKQFEDEEEAKVDAEIARQEQEKAHNGGSKRKNKSKNQQMAIDDIAPLILIVGSLILFISFIIIHVTLFY